MDFEEWEWIKISSEMFAGCQETAIGMRWVILFDRGEPRYFLYIYIYNRVIIL